MSIKILASSLVFLAATGVLTASAPYLLTADGNLSNSPVVTVMARSQLTVGDRFASAGAFGTAGEAYETAARLVRAQGKLPVAEMRRIANAQYYDGNFRGAAKTLKQLADEAEYKKDREAEFWALVDASQMAQLAGEAWDAQRYVRLAEELLRLPDLPQELHSALAEEDMTVFAPHLSSH